MLAAAAWGAALGALPGAQFTSPLLGPPVAYLFLRKRPLLSWQIPIMASAISTAVKERDPQGPYTDGSVLPVILLVWVVESLFSVPWPYIFQRRMRSESDGRTPFVRALKMSFGVGLLVFLACGLIIVGFAVGVYPVQPSQGREGIFDQSMGFLMATGGIGLAVYICRNAEKFDLNKEVESLFGWLLAFVALIAVPMIFTDIYRAKFHCIEPSPNCVQLSPPLEVFLNCLASLEAIAVVVWLIWRGRRTGTAERAIPAKQL